MQRTTNLGIVEIKYREEQNKLSVRYTINSSPQMIPLLKMSLIQNLTAMLQQMGFQVEVIRVE